MSSYSVEVLLRQRLTETQSQLKQTEAELMRSLEQNRKLQTEKASLETGLGMVINQLQTKLALLEGRDTQYNPRFLSDSFS
jgi:septal ring factor EnvC (AmiA/AmiB activator)